MAPLGATCTAVGNLTPPVCVCQMLCFIIPFEMVLLIAENWESVDLNSEVNRKERVHLGSSGLFLKVVQNLAVFKALYCSSNSNRFSYVIKYYFSVALILTYIISSLFLELDLQRLFDKFRIWVRCCEWTEAVLSLYLCVNTKHAIKQWCWVSVASCSPLCWWGLGAGEQGGGIGQSV